MSQQAKQPLMHSYARLFHIVDVGFTGRGIGCIMRLLTERLDDGRLNISGKLNIILCDLCGPLSCSVSTNKRATAEVVPI